MAVIIGLTTLLLKGDTGLSSKVERGIVKDLAGVMVTLGFWVVVVAIVGRVK